MAYVIGSKKGKDIAENMKSGETYKASDGSTWTKQSDGSVSVSHNGQTYNNAYKPTSGGNSQYTGSSSGIVTNNTTQQAIKDQMNANSIAWWSADEAGKKQLEENNKMLAGYLKGTVAYNAGTGTWSGVADGSGGITQEDILGWGNEYDQANQRPTAPESDPRINALLNEILARDKFSYNVTQDPLYEQYANMYRREGDRAMKETLAEAAAGAGGMNTYAVTAAQQANSYYNSQLNDKIPELYQLAYNMYLQDIEGQVRDLGLLQSMDATQYSRYRDTMNDWYNDKNFAYGTYQDAVQQGNWQTNFDYNSMWDNNYFNNDNYWKNKDLELTRGDIEYERNEAEKEQAQATIDWLIKNGVTTIDAEIIKQAGLDEATVKQMIANYQLQQGINGASLGGNGGNGNGNGDGNGGGNGDGNSGGGYDNGSLTTEQVKQIQEKLGVTADGYWGSNSKDAAGGMTADDAWEEYFGNEDADGNGDSKDMSDYTVVNTNAESWVTVSGLGRLSWQELATMVENGTVIEEVDDKNKRIYYRKSDSKTPTTSTDLPLTREGLEAILKLQ